jgi:aminopeptidase N
MQSALNNSDTSQSMDFNLKMLMNAWTREKNYPTLDVKQDYKTGNVQIRILSINDSAPSQNNRFMPITYATRTNPDFNQIWLNKTKWLKLAESSLNVAQIPLDDWIIINAQQAGNYKSNVTLEHNLDNQIISDVIIIIHAF